MFLHIQDLFMQEKIGFGAYLIIVAQVQEIDRIYLMLQHKHLQTPVMVMVATLLMGIAMMQCGLFMMVL